MSFKLIAIRPLEGCNEKFLKVLKKNEFYTFYKDYVFEKSVDSNKISLVYKSTLPLDLFWDNRKSQINVSAIVGKNGSGKSSILELFYVAIYNLSVIKEIIKAEEIQESIEFDFEELNNIVKSSNIDDINNNIRIFDDYRYYLENKDKEKEIIKIEEDVFVQIFFTIRGKIYVIDLKGETAKIFIFKEQEEGCGKFDCFIDENSDDQFGSLKQDWGLFYSIVNNYSLYGLNSNEIGDWITKIFHKNDSYQTPIVINPMRIEGKIDINTETDLSKSRLLSNILTDVTGNEKVEDSFRCLVKDKITSNLILKLKLNKFKNKEGEVEFEYLEKFKDEYLLDILNTFKIHVDENDITQTEFDEKYKDEKLNLVEKYAIEYILRKIEKIANVYEIEKKKSGSKFDFKQEKLVNKFLTLLKLEESHITFKLRQAINFLKYDYGSFSKEGNYQEGLFIPIKSLSKEIDDNLEGLKKKYLKLIKFGGGKEGYFIPNNFKLVNFIPPSFFEIDIDFENNMGRFSFLSSGEKQKIFSISSILYHIVNLNSKHSANSNEDVTSKYEYRFINIIFDEIELCFHPEMQRTFIYDLLARLQKIGHSNIYMNIIFVTHSPFILSDIPSQNIMFLEVEKEFDEKGEEKLVSNQKENQKETFGANIHDLLADSFFMNDGYMGEFAKNKIEKIIEWLDKCEEKLKKEQSIEPNNEIINTINLIGEPVLEYKLREKYYQIFKEEYDLENEKKEVKKRAIELGIIKE